jgi:Flp pilus assembly protein TadG
MYRRGERGQALVMVAAALGIFLLGAVGLATDVGQLYAHRQMAQNAADAAAQAGIMSIFNGTNKAANANAFGTDPFTCGAGDTRTPCLYASQNRFSNSAPDNVYVEFPAPGSVPGVPNAVSLIRVTVRRTVPTTFMRLLGRNSGTIAASATAAILEVQSPVPIIIIHPTNPDSFHKNGANNIVICGGPSKSIQVNSRSPFAVNDVGSGQVDLRLAGPGPTPTSPPCSGSGGTFGNHGGPSPYPGHLLPPDKYESPASIIPDPLLGVAPPEVLATMPDGTYTDYDPGSPGVPAECPAASELQSGTKCRLFSPGKYTGGIQLGQSVKVFAIFRPGIYWLNGGGFHLLSNSIVRVARAVPYNSDPVTGTSWTENVLFYNSGNASADRIEISANSGQLNNKNFPTAAGTYCESGGNCLIGAPNNAPYYGMLFFEDRATTANIQHEIWGGGGLTLMGTIYLTHTADGCPSCTPGKSIMADGFYQKLELGGNGGGVTQVIGQIIVDALSMGGASDIHMTLNPEAMFVVRQVALVR